MFFHKKTLLLILGFLLSVGAPLSFADDRAPTPTRYEEDEEGVDYFYQKTRLECIRKGIKELTGITPGRKYLGAIALKARNEIRHPGGIFSLDLDKGGDLNIVRFAYLQTVASYISTYGVCPEDKEGERGVRELSDKEARSIAQLLSSNRLDQEKVKVNKAAEILTEGEDYSVLEKLFHWEPVKPETAGGTIETIGQYRLLTAEQQKEFSITGQKNARKQFSHLRLPFSESNSFVNCINQSIKYQNNEGVKVGEETFSPQELCQKMANSCGYPKLAEGIGCKKYPGSSQERTSVKNKPAESAK